MLLHPRFRLQVQYSGSSHLACRDALAQTRTLSDVVGSGLAVFTMGLESDGRCGDLEDGVLEDSTAEPSSWARHRWDQQSLTM